MGGWDNKTPLAGSMGDDPLKMFLGQLYWAVTRRSISEWLRNNGVGADVREIWVCRQGRFENSPAGVASAFVTFTTRAAADLAFGQLTTAPATGDRGDRAISSSEVNVGRVRAKRPPPPPPLKPPPPPPPSHRSKSVSGWRAAGSQHQKQQATEADAGSAEGLGLDVGRGVALRLDVEPPPKRQKPTEADEIN